MDLTQWEFIESIPEQELKLLLVSDTHLNFEALKKLSEWYKEEGRNYDYVIMPGDFTNIKKEEHEDPAKEQEAIDGAKNTLQLMQTYTNQTKIIYIPGNHEPLSNYSREIQVDNCVNIHGQSYELAEDLVIFGLGGSTPATQFNIEHGKYEQVWNSFPYKNEQEFAKYLGQTFKQTFSKYGDQVISSKIFSL